jgi:hypothetical protein
VTPAAGSVWSPGTVSWKLYAAAVPTGVVPSKAARLRPNSRRVVSRCRSSGVSGEPWNACMATV